MAGAVGIALGALLASPAIALLAGPVASADTADDLASIGPVTIDGYTEALTYDTGTGAFDNFLVGSYDSYPYDLDVYFDPSGSNNAEVLLTIPFLFQGGFEEVDGTLTPIFSVDPIDFVSPDIGLVDLGGAVAPGEGVVTFGPFLLGGATDLFSVNSDTLAFDNYLVGAYNALPFDLDFFTGAPGSDTAELLVTIPSLFQFGFDDVAGTITPLFSIDPTDFISADIGLSAIGGL
jgi:hypothetical protein